MKKNDNRKESAQKTPRRAFVHSGSRRFRDIPKGFRKWYGNFCRHLGEKKCGRYHAGCVTMGEEV